MTEDLPIDPDLVASCGLYCGACRSYLKGRCLGCRENKKATWCKIRTCCAEGKIATCASCARYVDPNDCKKFNNFISKIFGFLFKSDRAACISQIKRLGLDGHAARMAESGRQSIKRS
jgi:hypothetical protein